MALNNITFVKGKGGLGRALPGQDYISGMIFYADTLPSGFATNDRIKQVFSIEDAEALGITDTYADETKATIAITIGNGGQTGNLLNIFALEGGDNGTKAISGGTLVDAAYKSVQILNYKKPSTVGTGTTATATDIAAAITLGYDTHGYSATSAGALITVIAKAGLGKFPNGKNLTYTGLGNLSASSTAWSGGVASKLAPKHYHIAEYFRIQPQGHLYVGIFPVPTGTYDFVELDTMSIASAGIIRQIGIYQDGQAFNASDLTTIQSIANDIDAKIAPLSVLLGSDFSGTTNLSTLTDLSTYDANKASVVLGQDAGNLGNQIAWAQGISVTTLGATLGAVSLAKVSEDIAWVSKFNISDSFEDETIGFANGLPVTDASVSTNLVNLIDNKRYIFLRKLVNVSGSFFNDSHCATLVSSDYAYIENNRTIDKAIRGTYADLIPNLNGPLTLNSDGTLATSTVAYLTSQANRSVNQMVRDNELSAVAVTIDPNQNVAATSTVVVTIAMVPIGVARQIIVNIGFTASI